MKKYIVGIILFIDILLITIFVYLYLDYSDNEKLLLGKLVV